MDTLLIIKDSVAFATNKATMVCQPCVKEVETCDNDVKIVGIICITLLIITLLSIVSYFIWKSNELKFKQMSVKEKNTFEENNREWKQKADLKNMLLILLKDYAEIKRDVYGNVVEKYKKDDYNAYKELLEKLINGEK